MKLKKNQSVERRLLYKNNIKTTFKIYIKMSKKYVLPFLILATIVSFSSCSKKLNPLASEYIKAEPQTLEAIGGKVPVTIDATFPAKWFNKNALVSITPVLR